MLAVDQEASLANVGVGATEAVGVGHVGEVHSEYPFDMVGGACPKKFEAT